MTTPRFSQAFANPAGSPIRELFPYLSRPGMISFAGGYPSASLFDAEGLVEASRRALLDSPGCLQYGATEGSLPFRERLAQLMSARGISSPASDILVTTGSQQAFDLLVRVLVEPGDTILVETPAYPAAIQALRLAGAKIVGIPVDHDGLNVDTLAELLAPPHAPRPKLLYTVPTFSNPSGTFLSPERRQKLVELAHRYGFPVIEDDPYSELRFEALDVHTLYAIGQKQFSAESPVIYLSSLSKTVSPALRLGWMVAPLEVIRRCAIAKQTADLCTSPFAQAVADAYLQLGRYDETVRRASAEYKNRMNTLVDAIDTSLGARLQCRRARGGMFLWAELSTGIDTQRLFHSCVEAGVLYVPGTAFYPGTPVKNTLRLSFAATPVPDIVEGVRRFAQAISTVEANEA